MFLAGACVCAHTHTHTHTCEARAGRGREGDDIASLKLQLPRGPPWQQSLEMIQSSCHALEKCLPMCLSPVQGSPHLWLGSFLCMYFTRELNCMDLWGNLAPCSCPSHRVIYCQAGKYCSSHPRRALFSERKRIASYWAPAFGDERKSLKRFQPNPWRGEQIFQLQDSRWRKCVPPLVYKAAQQLFGGPHPPGQTGVWKLYWALQTVCLGTPNPPRALITISNRQHWELSAGMARWPCLASRIQFCWALFLMLKKKIRLPLKYDAWRKTTHTLSCLLSPMEKLGFGDTGMSFLAAALRRALSACLCPCARPYRLSSGPVSSAGCSGTHSAERWLAFLIPRTQRVLLLWDIHLALPWMVIVIVEISTASLYSVIPIHSTLC